MKGLGIVGLTNENFEVVEVLDSKFNLTLEYHIVLVWKFQHLLIYTPKFSLATLQFLGSGGNDSYDWQILLILVIISTISMLMTTTVHITTCTQFAKH